MKQDYGLLHLGIELTEKIRLAMFSYGAFSVKSWKDILDRYIIFEEAILHSIQSNDLTDVTLEIEVSEWNFTKSFFFDLNVPVEHSAARTRIEQLFPKRMLKLRCKNIAYLGVDRVTRHGRPEMILVKCPEPASPKAVEASQTIFGFGLKDDSDLKDKILGKLKKEFSHMAIDTIDARIDIVFQEMEIQNFPTPNSPSGATNS